MADTSKTTPTLIDDDALEGASAGFGLLDLGGTVQIPGGDQFVTLDGGGLDVEIPGGDQFIPGGDQFVSGSDPAMVLRRRPGRIKLW